MPLRWETLDALIVKMKHLSVQTVHWTRQHCTHGVYQLALCSPKYAGIPQHRFKRGRAAYRASCVSCSSEELPRFTVPRIRRPLSA